MKNYLVTGSERANSKGGWLLLLGFDLSSSSLSISASLALVSVRSSSPSLPASLPPFSLSSSSTLPSVHLAADLFSE